jgi:butyryl-CoA dehydrogenase
VPKKIKIDDEWMIMTFLPSGHHKMGQRSTPAMHLEFGAKDNCKGWLVARGNGLFYMFRMMNAARLGTGLAGTYIASGLTMHHFNMQRKGNRQAAE